MTDEQARAVAVAVIKLLLPHDRADYDTIGAHPGLGERCFSTDTAIERLEAGEITVALNRELTAAIEEALRPRSSKPEDEG